MRYFDHFDEIVKIQDTLLLGDKIVKIEDTLLLGVGFQLK